jgi:hypothetical protein
MTMKCGNYQWGKEEPHYHNTAQQVRDCYAASGRINDGFLPDGPVKPQANARMSPHTPASEAQGRYIVSLQEERVLPADWVRFDYDQDLPFLEKADANSKINALKVMPKKDWGTNGSTPARKWDIPAGRYALRLARGGPQENDHAWRFYEVTHGKDGTRWQGYTFVVQLIGAPGAYRKNRLSRDNAFKVLEQIERDPNKGMTDYGLQSGVCGRCASPLTDPQSLARGIGPVCIQKLGW